MDDCFEGRVVRRQLSPASKSEREAVVLETPGGDLVLRRRGGNAFADPVLDELVGHRIRGTGQRTGYTLILLEWINIDEA
jgi:hypothetical protein